MLLDSQEAGPCSTDRSQPSHEDLESLRQVGQGQVDETAMERDVSEDR